jgi:uncharacterized protein (TIGR00730 family)
VGELYIDAAAMMARCLAAKNIDVVYGGGNVGLMGVLADAALEAGGRIIGVIPRFLMEKELAHNGLTALHVVDSMHERKALMAELSDAFIAMPGGYGTLDEFCEILTWAQLGLHAKPCGVLNVDGYYDPLLAMFDRAEQDQFLKPAHRKIVLSATAPEPLVELLLAYHMPTTEKWILPAQI